MLHLNAALHDMDVYASKTISQAAKADPKILNLSIGEPEFGPPEHLLSAIEGADLTLENFLQSVKRYEQSRGSPELRAAISKWYERRYGLTVDPEREIMVTHGGVEAITLALLSCTEASDAVAVTNPAYMLYKRAIIALGRNPVSFERPAAEEEYRALISTNRQFSHGMRGAKALIVNSPENPTGYVLTKREWRELLEAAERTGTWVIHDEVYDTMSFTRDHVPVRCLDDLGERTVLINSFSKKFGTPGLRMGWIVAHPDLIEIAMKAHDYLYLGVNILYERVANRLLTDPNIEQWFTSNNRMMKRRADEAIKILKLETGFDWQRLPHGGMFLFPNVRHFHSMMPPEYRSMDVSVGEAVARYLLDKERVATIPGAIYGSQGQENLRLILCPPAATFANALKRLADAFVPA